ncbi:hypothetical protein BSY19_5134 (plasmid) [Bosea sp. RAC05]|nr:hypothetical protein BSY19_5134 [Bosea sp. RAC05]
MPDRYPQLGPRSAAATDDEAMRLVRAIHPTAHKEGSTGFERSWWMGRILVAHQWPQHHRSLEPLWVRVAPAGKGLE